MKRLFLILFGSQCLHASCGPESTPTPKARIKLSIKIPSAPTNALASHFEEIALKEHIHHRTRTERGEFDHRALTRMILEEKLRANNRRMMLEEKLRAGATRIIVKEEIRTSSTKNQGANQAQQTSPLGRRAAQPFLTQKRLSEFKGCNPPR